jgi:hypothetical protein
VRDEFSVVAGPVLGNLLDSGNGLEQTGVEQFLRIAAVGALDKDSLAQLAELDEPDIQPSPLILEAVSKISLWENTADKRDRQDPNPLEKKEVLSAFIGVHRRLIRI